MPEVVITWFIDLAFVKNVCIGKVHQLPAGPDPVAKGMAQKQASWQAYGMDKDWQDVNLGNFHGSKEAAQAAIIEWYEDRRLKHVQAIKKACANHFSYRSGCVMCDAANMEKPEKPQ